MAVVIFMLILLLSLGLTTLLALTLRSAWCISAKLFAVDLYPGCDSHGRRQKWIVSFCGAPRPVPRELSKCLKS